MLKFLSKLFDGAAEEVGEAEELIHRPLYPIKPYTAVVDERLIRGSWPSKAVLAELKARGCKTVLNLCTERKQNEEVRAAGLHPFNIQFRDNTIPTLHQADMFLTLIRKVGPLYVHCEQGIGRTGCMVAAYRVKVQGWQPIAAFKEAESFGLCLSSQRNFILQLKKEK